MRVGTFNFFKNNRFVNKMLNENKSTNVTLRIHMGDKHIFALSLFELLPKQ